MGGHSQKERERYFSLVNKYSTVDAELNQKLQEDRCHSFIKRREEEKRYNSRLTSERQK